MDERIADIDPATEEPRGYYAIDPDGNLITLGRTQALKPGFRYATRLEIESALLESETVTSYVAPGSVAAETIAIIEAAPAHMKQPVPIEAPADRDDILGAIEDDSDQD